MNRLLLFVLLMGCMYLLPTRGLAQCNISAGKQVDYATSTITDANYGWDPWGARGPSFAPDPRFKLTPGYPNYPNNDGSIIVGYDLVIDAACWSPTYRSRTFYYDPETMTGPGMVFPAYPAEQIRKGGSGQYT